MPYVCTITCHEVVAIHPNWYRTDMLIRNYYARYRNYRPRPKKVKPS